MKLKMARGSTLRLARLYVQDSTSTTGAGLTGLTSASAGLVAYYFREGDGSPTVLALAAGTVGAYSSGGFVEVNAATVPGLYELGLPAAALAGGQSVLFYLRGAANMVTTLLEIELDAVNYQDGAAFGLSRLDATLSTRATPAQILATPGNLLATTSTGAVQHDMTQAVPPTNTAQTVGDALNGARAQAFGKWTVVGTTLSLFAPDGTTVVRAFTLDSATAPTQRL